MKGIANLMFILALILNACTTNEIPKQVKELVDLRMKIFRATQDSICRTTATKRAELAVDSFFLSFKKQYLLDSIHIPEKPVKPVVDTHLILNNTLPVKPFWDSLSIKKNQ